MSKAQKEYVEGLRKEIRELQQELAKRKDAIYTKEFKELALFAVSIVLPMGWTELPLMSPASIWHVWIGLGLWAIPIGIAAHLGCKLILLKEKKLLASTPVIGAVVLYAIIFYFAHRGFESRELEEVKQGLHASVTTTPSAKFSETVFTFRNDSAHEINTNIYCAIHKIFTDRGQLPLTEISISGQPFFSGKIGPNGDSRSDQCFFFFEGVDRVRCADVELWTEFSLANGSSRRGKKSARFVGIYEGEQFIWMPEASNLSEQDPERNSYCKERIRPPI